jgi:hypothetical protein
MNTEFSKCTVGGPATKETVGFKTNDAELFLDCLFNDFAQFIHPYFFKGIHSHERVPLTANTLGRWLEWLVGWLHPQECSQLYCTPGVKGCILYMCQET